MKTYIQFILFGALLISTAATSQDIQTATIEWNCTSTFQPQNGTLSNENTKIVSSPDRITWYNSNGDVTQTFSVVSTVGSWGNVSNNGSILFRVNSSTQEALVEFERSDGTTIIRLHFSLENPPVIYELVVDNLHAL